MQTSSSDEPVTSSLESSDDNVTKNAKNKEQEQIEMNSNENKDTSNLAAEIQAVSPKKNSDLGDSKCFNMLPCLDSEIILVKQ